MTAEPEAIVEHQIRRLLGDRACLASWIDTNADAAGYRTF